MPTFLVAGKRQDDRSGSRQLLRESVTPARIGWELPIKWYPMSILFTFMCRYVCCRYCIICDVSNVVRAFASLFGCVNVPYISVYCKSIDSLPLFALIGTKDPNQSFLLGSPWESEWWSTIPGKTWTSKWRKENPVTWSNRKKTASWVPPEPFCGTVLSTIEWIFSREWQGAAPLCDLFQNSPWFCGEGRPCFFFLQVARG